MNDLHELRQWHESKIERLTRQATNLRVETAGELHRKRAELKRQAEFHASAAQALGAAMQTVERYHWLRERTASTGLERFVARCDTQFLDEAVDACMAAELDAQYKSWERISAGAADSHLSAALHTRGVPGADKPVTEAP